MTVILNQWGADHMQRISVFCVACMHFCNITSFGVMKTSYQVTIYIKYLIFCE
jgi:hypothetical protein